MSGIQQTLLGGSPAGGYQIERSLRFNSADSAYLNRTFGTPTSTTTWTLSWWIKRSNLTSNAQIFSAGGDFIYFGGGTFVIKAVSGAILETSQVFRDASAWYNFVVIADTSNATADNRVRLYVNGSQVTAFSTRTNPSINATTIFNANGSVNRIGGTGSIEFLSAYLTEINFIDGQALTPSSFGQSDPNTGVWSPIKYTGTYGTNGFYLNFSDNSNTTSTTLGKDSSGNGNNWTPNLFSVTAGAGNDSLVDTPTSYGTDTGVGGEVRGNYATLNPLIVIPRGTISNGNLNYLSGSTSSHGSAAASFTLPTTGKWYWEVTACNNSGGSGNNESIGIANIQNNPQLPAAGSEVGSRTGDYIYRSSGVRISGGSSVSYGATYTNGDVIGVAWDSDAGTLVFYKNGVSQGTAYSSITQVEGRFAPASSNAETSNGDNYNFGQRPFEKWNGSAYVANTAPSGFKALCTQNLPTPTIGATSTTQANDYMNVVLYTGNGGTAQDITGVGFQPDFVWLKSRNSGSFSHRLYDAVRGAGKELYSNADVGENTVAQSLTAFISDGFSLGTDTNNNATSTTYVAWNWKANGAGSSNTSGTITSTVSANTTAGFSIVTYTGNGTTGTVGHGLGVTPSMIIVKSRSTAQRWTVFHTSTSNAYIYLNETFGSDTANANVRFGNNTSVVQPTSTLFTIGSSADVNQGTTTYVAYCFVAVAGYSAFGSYTGNGDPNGPFVYTGFRPRWVMIKGSSFSSNWILWDTARDTYNMAVNRLLANGANAESSAFSYDIDITSNGFKLRNSNADINSNTATFIYAAFAESPFKYSLAR